jgi:hypothetical protein
MSDVERLALALHKTRVSNESPEYDMEAARERATLILDVLVGWCSPHMALPVDPRVEEAFDLLGGMWSWSEANDYLATGTTWYLRAGRILREVVGRPAKPPAALASE